VERVDDGPRRERDGRVERCVRVRVDTELGRRRDGLAREERLKKGEELDLVHAQVKVEEEEELALHEVDLGEGEDGGVARPVLVLGRRVCENVACQHKRAKAGSSSGATHR